MLDGKGCTPLHVAADHGNTEILGFLISNGASVDSMAESGTALHRAAANGKKDAVEFLLSHNANELDNGKGQARTFASVKDDRGRTALHAAAEGGHEELCDYLVEKMKLDVNLRDNEGYTALHHAVAVAHLGTIRCLVGVGADVNLPDGKGCTPLHVAAHHGNTEILGFLISNGASVDSMAESGTALHWAAANGKKDAVELLLSHNANPNSIGPNCITPLLLSISAKSLECMKLLVKEGADTNLVAGGVMPLIVANNLEQSGMVQYMQEHGAVLDLCGYPNLAVQNFFTPLVLSIMVDSIDCLHLLLEEKADPNIGPCGIKPLCYAAGMRKPRMVELLLESGADPNAVGSAGLPLEFAALNCDEEIMRILIPVTTQIDAYPDWSINGIANHIDIFVLAYGGDVSTLKGVLVDRDTLTLADAHGRSLLHMASVGENVDIMQFLVKSCHVEFDACDIFGMTPLMLAAYYGRCDAAEYLIHLGANVNVKSTALKFTALHVAAYRGWNVGL